MIDLSKLKSLNIGRQGENKALSVEFDIKPWIDAYGNGVAELLHQRSGDEVAYVATTTQSGTTVTWELTSDDTGFNGYGRAQLNYYVGDLLVKSVVFTTVCGESLTDETETPAPAKTALDIIAEKVLKMLTADNIKAGNNVTLDKDGNDITINSEGGGASDYSDLENKPQINSVELVGNKSLSDLGIQPSGSYATETELGAEETARENADNNLQGQIDAITVSSDVVDVVGTYAELQAYDTTHIKANDIVKVLQDSTHRNALSYYRWVITGGAGAWVYVGSEGPFYTKGEADALLNNKADNSALADYATVAAMNAGLATKQDAIPVISGEKTIAQLVALGIGQYVVGENGLEITGVLDAEDGETELTLLSVEGDNVLVGENVLFLDANSDCYKILKVDDGETITYQGSAVATWADVSFIKNTYAFNDYFGATSTAINLDNGLYRTSEPCTVTVKTGSASSKKDVIDDFEGIAIRTDMQFILLGTVNRIYTKASASQAYFANKEDIGSPLTFSNLSVEIADWVVDSTYSGYGYKAVLTCTGVTSNMVADVYFNGASAILGTLAPFCDTGNGTVTIYCSANDSAVTIDKVVAV